jgi:hypothetical protein
VCGGQCLFRAGRFSQPLHSLHFDPHLHHVCLLQSIHPHLLHVCLLQAILYNLRDTSSSTAAATVYAKPALMTQAEWDREYAANAVDDTCSPPLPIIPVAYGGFAGLAERRTLQHSQLKQYLQLAQVRAKLEDMCVCAHGGSQTRC